MSESLPVEKAPRDAYGWSNKELKMSLLFQGEYLDFFPKDKTAKRSIKSAARWDGHAKQVIVRATDGFEYKINNVHKLPSPEEIQDISAAAKTAWRVWYREQINSPENKPDENTIIH